jgi:hypothetical protein
MFFAAGSPPVTPDTEKAFEALGAKGVLYDLILALDEAAADVWDDGSPWKAGVREGLERAAVLVRFRLALIAETDRLP